MQTVRKNLAPYFFSVISRILLRTRVFWKVSHFETQVTLDPRLVAVIKNANKTWIELQVQIISFYNEGNKHFYKHLEMDFNIRCE